MLVKSTAEREKYLTENLDFVKQAMTVLAVEHFKRDPRRRFPKNTDTLIKRNLIHKYMVR